MRIIDLCRRQGLPELEFQNQQGGFLVTFAKDPYTPERLQAMELSERQIQAVLYVKEHTNTGPLRGSPMKGRGLISGTWWSWVSWNLAAREEALTMLCGGLAMSWRSLGAFGDYWGIIGGTV
jgi:hypothetical protein